MADDPAAPPAAAAAPASVLYPDGGANPSGHAEQIRDPATGEPKYTAQPSAPAPDPEAAAPAATPDPAAPAEAKPGEPAPAEEPKAPVDLTPYADLKLPDTLVAETALFDEFKTIAAEAGVAPAAAEKLLPFAEKLVTAQIARLQEAAKTTFDTQQSEWVGQLNSMPEFQGEARERSLTLLGRMMDEFGSPKAREYFDATGAGNNPEIVKMLLSLGEALMEGAPTPPGQPGKLAGPQAAARPGRKSAGEILYPDSVQ